MKYYISFILFVLVILVGISTFFPVKDSPKSSSHTGWVSSLSRVSPTAKDTKKKASAPGNATTKNEQISTPTITGLLLRHLTPTKKAVLGTDSTPTPTLTESVPIATPTPVPLFLTLTSPTGDTEVNVPTITIVGKTVPSAEVFVNDQTIRANTAGIFSTTISLEEGENLIDISANNSSGIYNEKELVVTYNKP